MTYVELTILEWICVGTRVRLMYRLLLIYSDTSANEDNSFRNHIR